MLTISIALCTYNGARYLPEQLASIQAQTRVPDEIIICDDGSTDGTRELLTAFAGAMPCPVRLRWNPQNLGVIQNFDQALGCCTGDIIAFCDQDDIWHPEKLATFARVFAEAPAVGLVACNATLIDEASRPLGKTLWEVIPFLPREQRQVRAHLSMSVLVKHGFAWGTTAAFRAGFLEVIRPIPDGWIHDYWTSLLVAAMADVHIIDTPLVQYRQHQAQCVGAPTNTVSERFARPNYPAEHYLRPYERLRQFPDRVRDAQALHYLLQKSEHLAVRNSLPANRFARLRPVVAELASLRYFHYANGLLSAMKDLLK